MYWYNIICLLLAYKYCDESLINPIYSADLCRLTIRFVTSHLAVSLPSSAVWLPLRNETAYKIAITIRGTPCSPRLKCKLQEKYPYFEIFAVNLVLEETIFLKTYTCFFLLATLFFCHNHF